MRSPPREPLCRVVAMPAEQGRVSSYGGRGGKGAAGGDIVVARMFLTLSRDMHVPAFGRCA